MIEIDSSVGEFNQYSKQNGENEEKGFEMTPQTQRCEIIKLNK